MSDSCADSTDSRIWANLVSKLKPNPADPSIDDVLASIREAIHEETARDTELRADPATPSKRTASLVPPAATRNRQTAVSGSMRELRVSLQPPGQAGKQGTVTARSEDFLSLKNKLASLHQSQPTVPARTDMAGTMGGDVRLEDALARMNTAGELQRGNNPPPPPPAQPEPVIPQTEYAPTREPVQQPAAPVAPPVEAPLVAQSAPAMQPEPAAAQQLPAPLAAPSTISPDATMAAAGAFDRLADELFSKSTGGGQALADSAREMIKPLLQQWLDDNLPALVERLVREEIERVTRKGGR